MYRLLGLLLLLFAIPPEVFAAENIFEPAPGSFAMESVKALFGDLSIGIGGSDAFSAVIFAFNSAILSVAGILMAYTILVGTIGTAHDGEMLGKKFFSAFIPVRYGLFAASIMPIASGYCTMQMIVYWLVVQGIGLGDQTWTTFVSHQNITKVVAAGVPRPQTADFTYKLLETLTCNAVMEKQLSGTDPNWTILQPGKHFGMTKVEGKLSTVYSWGEKTDKPPYKKDYCGSITVKNFTVPAVTTDKGMGINSLFNVQEGFDRMREINKEHQVQVANLITRLTPIAAKIANDQMPSIEEIDAINIQYEQNVKRKAAEIVQSMDAFKDLSKNASQNGFFTAGAFFVPISAMADMVHRSVADVPTSSGPGGTINSKDSDDWGLVKMKLQDLYSSVGRTVTDRSTLGTDKQAGLNDSSWIDTFKDSILKNFDVTKMIDKAFGDITSFALLDGEHPMMATHRMGSYLLGVASIAFTALMVLSTTVGNAPGIGLALQTATLMFVAPVAVAGFLLTYALPMMPFLLWIGAIVGYLVLVVEAIIAAPLWAAMHLTPEGGDITGSGGQGYKLVLSLLLRPVLMVFGLIAALVLMGVLGEIINRMFAGVFLLTQTDSGIFVKIFGTLLAGPLIYGAMQYTFIKKMFDAITHIPDELLNWIGGGGPMLGKFANDMGGDRSDALIVGAAVGNKLGGGGASPGGAPGGDDKKSKLAGIDNLANNKANSSGLSDTGSMGGSESGGGSGSALNGSTGSTGTGNTESTFAQQKQAMVEQQKSHAENVLGGAGSPNATSFNDRLNTLSQQNPNTPMSENVNKAFSQELSNKYGKGTGETLALVSGDKLSGEEFNATIGKYDAIHDNLSASGLQEPQIKDMVHDTHKNIASDYKTSPDSIKNGGNEPLSSFVHAHLDKLNK